MHTTSCEPCGGTGLELRDCPDCGTRGHTVEPESLVSIRCDACDGHGDRPAPDSPPCDECDGTGRRTHEVEDIEDGRDCWCGADDDFCHC